MRTFYLTGNIFFEQDSKYSPINSTHYAKLYHKMANVSIDSVYMHWLTDCFVFLQSLWPNAKAIHYQNLEDYLVCITHNETA